jgi:hypothetical protein
VRRSPSRSRVNSMLPAPMKAMRVTPRSIAHLRESAQIRRNRAEMCRIDESPTRTGVQTPSSD